MLYPDTVKLRVIVARVPSNNSIFTVLRARPVQHNFIIQSQDKMHVVCMHWVLRIGLTHETMYTQLDYQCYCSVSISRLASFSYVVGMWEDRERPICRSKLKLILVTPAHRSAPAPWPPAVPLHVPPPLKSVFWNVRSPLRSRSLDFLPAPLRFPLHSHGLTAKHEVGPITVCDVEV